MTMTPVETLQKLYSHVRVGEWAEAEEYLSNDFVAYEPDTLPFGGEWSGENVLKRLFGTVMGSFDDPKVEPIDMSGGCLLYTSPSPRDKRQSRMPSSA